MMRALQARRIRGRRAEIDMLVEFVLAVVLIMVVFLVIKVAQAASFGGTNPKGTVIVESVSESIPCNYWLMNFLRAKNPAGDVFSDLLSLAKTSEDKEKFKAAATDYFEKNYKRAYRLERWQLKAETLAATPILSVGYQDKRLPRLCSQKIVSKEGPIKVTLGVDY